MSGNSKRSPHISAESSIFYLIDSDYKGGSVVASIKIENREDEVVLMLGMFGAGGRLWLIGRGEINLHRGRIGIDTYSTEKESISILTLTGFHVRVYFSPLHKYIINHL